MKSEGSQTVYNSLRNAVKTKFGNRIMEELGNVKGLEKDNVKNYILIPHRVKDKDGKDCRLFDKPFKELERDDSIKIVYCILNWYRDNLNKRIKMDARKEAEDQLADEFWGPDDPIPWMETED